jgi:hypothetical protein
MSVEGRWMDSTVQVFCQWESLDLSDTHIVPGPETIISIVVIIIVISVV